MKSSTLCPNCEAEGTLNQEVSIAYETIRTVEIVTIGGKQEVHYGRTDDFARADGEVVQDVQMIVCRDCGKSWDSEKALLTEGPHEHRCSGCDWWGFVPWQHRVEAPQCAGEVHRLGQLVEAIA